MFKINLKNGKSFTCDSNTTVFEAAKNNGITLEHSCLIDFKTSLLSGSSRSIL
jgi:ferredoxin